MPPALPKRRGRPPKVAMALEVPAAPVKRRGRPPKIIRGLEKMRPVKAKIPPLSEGEITALLSGKPPQKIAITAPNLTTATITVVGVTPYVQNAFTEKQRLIMEETQRQGQQARGKKVRKPKDFDAIYRNAQHRSKEDWIGIPAAAFRNAMIDATRLVGVTMQHAKMSIFIEADGYDAQDMRGLVKIQGEPRPYKAPVRNSSGVADIRWRPMWEKWKATVRVTWDADQYSATDIMNLMLRAGLQVGIGEGRPNSPKSNGQDWGRFRIAP
jgi:hypothetical protein